MIGEFFERIVDRLDDRYDLERWREDGWRRRYAIPVIVLVLTVLLGAVIGTALGKGTGGPSRTAQVQRLQAMAPGTVLLAPDENPDKLAKPRGLGSEHAGLAVVAVSDTDVVRTKNGERRAPTAGRLLTFRLGDWACGDAPCEPWSTLKPTIEIDGEPQDLPGGGSTFVVALPPGTLDVELKVVDSGFAQSLSLLDATRGSGNIAYYATRNRGKKVTLGAKYQLTERTSIALNDAQGQLRDQFVRNVTVDSVQSSFFSDGARPSGPGKAFLVVSTYYAYAGTTANYAFDPEEVVFQGKDGTRYPASKVDTGANDALLRFEIPASLKKGTLVIGGTTQKVSTTQVPYTSMMQLLRQPITVG